LENDERNAVARLWKKVGSARREKSGVGGMVAVANRSREWEGAGQAEKGK
jgi:hypothetical protein